MYSYEDRIKAVRLYMKLGKRLGVTIRQLGYPTKNTLIGWYREFIAKQSLRAGYNRSRDRFTVEQKQHAVQHYLDHGHCIAFTLRVLGYPSRDTFSKWLDELHPEVRMRMVGRAPNVQHPMETKKAAVLELCIRDTSAEEIAKKVKVCRPTLYNWKNELLGPECHFSPYRVQSVFGI
jgi:putative transposase